MSNLRDSCDSWKLLQHRVPSTTGHQWSLNVPSCTVLLYLCIFGACRCITTALFSVAVVSARAMERSDSITSSHPMIPVHCLLLRSSHVRLPTQCIVRIISQLQSLHLAMLPARSELSAIQQSSLLNCALCPQSSCHSNINSSSSAILLLGTTSSGTSCDWQPLTPFQQT